MKIKYNRIEIKPYSNGEIPIRMYFDHTVGRNVEVRVRVDDGKVVEELVFQVVVVG